MSEQCDCEKMDRIMAVIKQDAIDARLGVYRRRKVQVSKCGTQYSLTARECPRCNKPISGPLTGNPETLDE